MLAYSGEAMKKTEHTETENPHGHDGHANLGTNGDVIAVESTSAPLSIILAGLQTMRDGDFSVRLPGSWTGLAGKLADTFNDIVSTNQQMAQELKRLGQGVGERPHRGLAPSHDRSHPCHCRGSPRQPDTNGATGRRRAPSGG